MSSSSEPLRIYFCASIRAGRQDADLYRLIIDKLKTYGRVLTEHIADMAPWDAAHLTEFPSGQTSLDKDKAIFATDMNWLESADVVVAECTQPSLGVGFELGVAWKLNKSTLCLYRPINNTGVSGLSAMIRGVDEHTSNDRWKIVDYDSVDQLDEIFAQFIAQHLHS